MLRREGLDECNNRIIIMKNIILIYGKCIKYIIMKIRI